MDGFQIDARRWRFLDTPARYIKNHESCGLKVKPLKRQFKTAKEILARLGSGRGVLLADDVGLGKTTVGARRVGRRQPGQARSHLRPERGPAPTLGRGARAPCADA